MANPSFNKVVVGDKIVYQTRSHWDGKYHESVAVVKAVSKDSIIMMNGAEFYKFKNRWCTGDYARSTVKLISVQTV